ncbi:hypothetical protein J4209_00665 [Candidatus Woesearchaeota archaeon]|nr:hypothetical protein [Candidatus Woesearchaeota archaeon]
MAIKLKKLEKKLPLFKKILGDEFLAVSAIILFESFMKLGYGVYSVAITLLIVAASSFMAGVTVKGYTKNKC